MRLDEAVEMFKNAIRLTPGNVNFHRNLPLAYEQQGEKSAEEAILPPNLTKSLISQSMSTRPVKSFMALAESSFLYSPPP